MNRAVCWFAGLVLILGFSCSTKSSEKQVEEVSFASPTAEFGKKTIDFIRLPPGFRIDYFAENVPGARSLVRGEDGTIYVGTRDRDKVYAIPDADGDHQGDRVLTIASGLNTPNGVALHKGDLYVATISKVRRYPNIAQNLKTPPKPQIIREDLPTDRSHGWKYIAFGPDGKLYVPVGAPCNICLSEHDERYASITRMDPDGSNFEVYVHGVRNTVGFDWHPQTGKLFFTDNGRDNMGDDQPTDELNRVDKAGQHFGYPFCHQGDLPDPEYGQLRSCSDFVPPIQKLGPHVAALGMTFYEGEQFPEEYHGGVFIAEHGSWNRSEEIGYRVSRVPMDGEVAQGYEIFAEGWLNEDGDARGRPVDVLELPDGSLLISDDLAGCVYRVSYTGE